MNCRCNGTGFAKVRGYRSAKTGKFYPDAESVERCPEYLTYFRMLLQSFHAHVESKADKLRVIAKAQLGAGCAAAIAQHRTIIEQAREASRGR